MGTVITPGKVKRNRDILFLQLLFIVLAFALMVITSSIFVSDMLRAHLDRDATDMLTQTKLKIEAELAEPYTTLAIVSNTIRSMILRGEDSDTVFRYLKNIHAEMDNKTSGFAFDGFFAYFEAYGGVFFHSGDWTGDENYDPTNRPWYKAAIEAGNKIATTPIYFGARTSQYVITYVHRIQDDNGIPLAVVCLNMPIDSIRNHVAEMKLTNGSYGLLLDEKLDIITHPEKSLIGINLYDIYAWQVEYMEKVKASKSIIQQEMQNYAGVHTVMFSVELGNGWILCIQTPKSEYYQALQRMLLILIILGTVLAAALSLVLISIDRARKKADVENREKSLQIEAIEKMREADERAQLMLDSAPVGVNFWDKNINNIACNEEAVKLFGLKSKQEYLERFFELSPEFQPNGKRSKELAKELVKKAFEDGYGRFEWIHQKPDGEPIPCELTLVRVSFKGEYTVLGYMRDLRELKQMMRKIEQRDNLLNTVNQTATVLLATEEEDKMLSSIMEGMELLGRSVDVDRVQIWKNEMADGALNFVLKYEWLSETGKRKTPVPMGLSMPYNSIPGWEEKFMHGEYINLPLRELPQGEQDILKPFDIESIVIIPLFLRERFWGFFSLDDCRNVRTFSDDEINILRSGGLLIANAFLRNDMMQNIRTGAALLETALREAQNANTAKSKFLATMSHEIRTPMNVILGITETYLQNETVENVIREGFEKIYNAGDLLLHIINDILDLSKIEAGKLDLLPVKYDIMSLINDATQLNVLLFQHKPVKFSLLVDENIPAEMFGDELRIKQILNNLLSNAFKYTDTGEVSLFFGIDNQAQAQDPGITLLLRVSDTGCGMTEEQIKKIFDEYSRFNLEANRSTVGTGLGMAITQNLVKLMNGKLIIESEPGKGTIVNASIPQATTGSVAIGRKAAERLQNFSFAGAAQSKNRKIIRQPMPYGKVLVVDDMKSNLDVARLLLNPYQLKIDTVETGLEAIELIKTGREYDIVFMDHMMPFMDGIETTKKMRELGYKRPVFALTANAVAGQQEMFYANGFDGYISKPIDIRQLNDSLNKFIRDKHQSEE